MKKENGNVGPCPPCGILNAQCQFPLRPLWEKVGEARMRGKSCFNVGLPTKRGLFNKEYLCK